MVTFFRKKTASPGDQVLQSRFFRGIEEKSRCVLSRTPNHLVIQALFPPRRCGPILASFFFVFDDTISLVCQAALESQSNLSRRQAHIGILALVASTSTGRARADAGRPLDGPVKAAVFKAFKQSAEKSKVISCFPWKATQTPCSGKLNPMKS